MGARFTSTLESLTGPNGIVSIQHLSTTAQQISNENTRNTIYKNSKYGFKMKEIHILTSTLESLTESGSKLDQFNVSHNKYQMKI